MHKPYGVLSQFTSDPKSRWGTLAEFLSIPDVYPTGRLDADSEGLLILTSNGALQSRLSHPRWGHWRTYHVQVEGSVNEAMLTQIRRGIWIKQRLTMFARARELRDVPWGPRVPPIRYRSSIPTSWLEISLQEGKNRQIRRMTAAVGLPTLRLIRVSIEIGEGQPPLNLDGLSPGQWRYVNPNEEMLLQQLVFYPRHSFN
jgi:23S rRNA pseudouridine2457 synthase